MVYQVLKIFQGTKVCCKQTSVVYCVDSQIFFLTWPVAYVSRIMRNDVLDKTKTNLLSDRDYQES